MHFFKIRYFPFILIVISMCSTSLLKAQCSANVSTYPYTEDFELSQGNWNAGGSLSDWAWGTPSKPVIIGAGSGLKCWVVGGLTTSFYNYSEQSYVESPCFDFTNLQHPYIVFKIFWESEKKYDGTNLQYSLNGGTSWTNVGSFIDPVNCLNNNWYNETNITYLSWLGTPKEGWGGNIQATQGICQGGSGSAGWLVANHCMSYLAGKTQVIFRFTFGAGTTCNSFDGIAFDSVSISEAPPNAGNITYSCTNANTVAFTGTTVECPDTIAWNFGDPGSGAANTASATLNPSHTFSAPGSYTVSLSLNGPCNAPAVITKVIDILNVVGVANNICFGASNGSITLTTTGGTGPYSYNWTGGVTTQNRTGLSAGTYTVTVTDPQSCPVVLSETITQATSPITPTITPTNGSCAGGGGSINLSVTGGTSPYTYNWGGGIATQNRTGLSSGTYTVTITDNGNCTATASATITGATALTLTATPFNVSCNGGSDGSITLTPGGGAVPYSYNWGGGVTTQNRSGLAAGTYTVTLTDNNGCTITATATINQPQILTATLASTNITCNGANDGTINTTPAGGTVPYTYNWGGGITTQNRTGLGNSTYTVTVTDSKNCTATASATITQPPAIIITPSSTNSICGGSTGTASITVTGGTGGYSFSWSNGAPTQNISALATGTYSVTVKDASNCSATSSVFVGQVNAPTVTVTPVEITCSGANNGQVNLTISGGTPAYTYNWSNAQTTQNIANLGPGTYSVTVHDAQNCVVIDSSTVTSPAPINIVLNKQDESCFGNTDASITSIVTGGTPVYTYSWSNGATTTAITNLAINTYTLTVTDQNLCTATASAVITQPQILAVAATPVDVKCFGQNTGAVNLSVNGGTPPYNYNWNDAATTQNLSSVPANNYAVTVTDANSCTVTSATVVNQPAQIVIAGQVVNATCFGQADGSIQITVTGGVPAYTYLWSNNSSAQNQNNIANNTYTVSVTDANNCLQTNTFVVNSPPQIIINTTVKDVSCFGGADGGINVVVTGGTSPYSYLWSDNNTNQNEANLSIGTYSLTVTDNNNCTAVASNIIVTQPSAVSLNISATPQSCLNQQDGTAGVIVTGGTSPYQYSWSNGAASPSISNLATGQYFVTITDSHNCQYSDSVFVPIVPPLVIAGTEVQPVCPPLADGSISVIVSGGTPGYNYAWNIANNNSATLDNIIAGNYIVTVTDTKGCFITDSFALQYQYTLYVTTSGNVTIKLGENTGITATPSVNNGVSYDWFPSSGLICNNCASTEAAPVTTLTYQISIVDVNGCIANDSLTITVVPDYDLFIPNAFTPNGDGNNDFFEMFGNKQAMVFWDIEVFDRWGEKVFESNDLNFKWDGTYKGRLLEPTVLSYIAKVAFLDGHTRNNIKGSVTLIR